jgi:replicative DNA helicase
MASIAVINQQGIEQRGLPADQHTERTILGAMLLEQLAVNDATALLEADDFSLDSHRRVYRAIMELLAVGHAVDSVTVRDVLRRKKEMESVGGEAWFASLTAGIPFKLNIEDYVRIVKDKSLLRQMMGIFNEGTGLAGDASESAEHILNQIEARLAEVADKAIRRSFSSTSSTSRAARSPACAPTTTSSTR